MNTDIQPLLKLLEGQFGWVATAIVWIGALRLAIRPFNAWLQLKLTAFANAVATSPETSDDAWLREILTSRWYRVLAFFIDIFFSLKLPTSATLDQHQAAVNAPIETTSNAGPLILIGFLLFVSACATVALARPITLVYDRAPQEQQAGVTNYMLYKATGTNWTPIIAAGLNTNITYTATVFGDRFRVTAQGRGGESDPSNTATNGVPNAPGILRQVDQPDLNQ